MSNRCHIDPWGEGEADSRAPHNIGKRKMRTNFFFHKLFEHPQRSGHPGKIPGTSQVPSVETQGRQTFEGGHKLFDPHPFAWKTPPPHPAVSGPQKLIFVLFFLAWNIKVRKRHISRGEIRAVKATVLVGM